MAAEKTQIAEEMGMPNPDLDDLGRRGSRKPHASSRGGLKMGQAAYANSSGKHKGKGSMTL